jgi:hypothetical protein
MKKSIATIVSMALILCFTGLAQAGDSTAAAPSGSAKQPDLLMQGSDINMQGGKIHNVGRIYLNNRSAITNPPTNKDLTSRWYVQNKKTNWDQDLHNQINQLNNQINQLKAKVELINNSCPPGYVLANGVTSQSGGTAAKYCRQVVFPKCGYREKLQYGYCVKRGSNPT